MADEYYDAFLSYSASNLGFAEEAHRRLTGAGFKVWFDKVRLKPGFQWHKEIKNGCEASRVLLPVLTPQWKLSEWTKFETYGAETILPLVVAGEIKDIFTAPLLQFQHLSIHLANDSNWQELFEALRTLLDRPASKILPRIVDVQFQPNPYFVGREQELNLIHERLHQQPGPGLTQARVQAVIALGGIGKTTLARHYMEKFWRCYRHLFWVDCRLGIESEMARLCGLLHPKTIDSTDVTEKAQMTMRTLAGDEDRLLVLDNALDEVSIERWIPKRGHCRTLITSRFAHFSAAVETIELDVFTPEQAHSLLVARSGRQPFEMLAADQQKNCSKLAEQLGYLPLALEQAAAYIQQQGKRFTFADYCHRYERAAASLLNKHVRGSTEYPEPVLNTWKTSLDKLTVGARAIMRIMSFLAPTPLPLNTLIEGIEAVRQESSAATGSMAEPVGDAEVWIADQIDQLRAYSMVSGDGQSITLHSLVQTVERLQLGMHHQSTLVRSLGLIDAAFDNCGSDVQTWPILDPLSNHAETVAKHADKAGITDPTASVMNKVAYFLFAKAQYAKAESLMRRALALDEQSRESEHPDVARDLNHLALLLLATNRVAEAEPLMRRALAINEYYYGADHGEVAACLDNLAKLLEATNRPAEAEPLLRRALAIDEQFHGADHPYVGTHLINLAQHLTLYENRRAEAEPLMRRALAIFEESYGTDHPEVAIGCNNLARLHQAKGRFAEAEALIRRALAIDEKSYGHHRANDEESLGHDHPVVGRDLSILSALLQATNRLTEAEPLMRRALAIFEHSHGAGHPNVADALNNLAMLLMNTNRLADAEPLIRRALDIDEQSYGSEHPKVACRLNNLAHLLQATNRLADAEPLIRRALAIEEQANGADHPDVAMCLNNLARLLQATNRRTEAEPLMRRALAIVERSCGPKHQHVANCLNNLAKLLWESDRAADAEPIARRAIMIYEESVGENDPRVAAARSVLTRILCATKRYQEAVSEITHAVRILLAHQEQNGYQHPIAQLIIENYRDTLRATDLSNDEIDRRLAEAGGSRDTHVP